jgi:hypothetical protein
LRTTGAVRLPSIKAEVGKCGLWASGLGTAARPYEVVMDAWRTSCPRLPVWETANDLGLVERRRTGDSRPGVAVTDAGHRYLALRRPRVKPAV